MIIPWRDIAPDTLENLIKEFILREGTDYGDVEISLIDKINQVKHQIHSEKLFIVYSQLHESVDIKTLEQLHLKTETEYDKC